ncbi:hypothetical protein [Bradyrhizobium sp.]|uniref:hypothetical protein n=1 Tax=Bradyrhizobium sp. TaxID=376 RepID=UPI00260DA79C|nr:hypothetical protein [Bradyrhizobium sp.]
MLEIFDAFGNVRSDLDKLAAEIEQLDDVRREKLFGVVSANAAKREAEENLALARITVREREAAYHTALATRDKFNPPQTHQQALQAAIAANNGQTKPSADESLKKLADKVAALEKKTKADRKPEHEAELMAARKALAIARQPMVLAEANNALAAAQSNVVKASRALKDAERANGEAIAAWLSANTDRVTHESLVRDAAMRDAERALASKAKEPEPAGLRVWPLEQNLTARGAQKSKRVYFGR